MTSAEALQALMKLANDAGAPVFSKGPFRASLFIPNPLHPVDFFITLALADWKVTETEKIFGDWHPARSFIAGDKNGKQFRIEAFVEYMGQRDMIEYPFQTTTGGSVYRTT